VPEAKGDYREFGAAAVATLKDHALLAKIQEGTNIGLQVRRQQFDAGLRKLLT